MMANIIWRDWSTEALSVLNNLFFQKGCFIHVVIFAKHGSHKLLENLLAQSWLVGQIQRTMKRLLIDAKLPETLSPHSLRHTYTSLMAEAGVELEAIQRLLGHKNDRVTRDIYLHVTKAQLRLKSWTCSWMG
jgi:integrase